MGPERPHRRRRLHRWTGAHELRRLRPARPDGGAMQRCRQVSPPRPRHESNPANHELVDRAEGPAGRRPTNGGVSAPPGPRWVLCNAAGKSRRRHPAMNQTPRTMSSWIELKVPLAGGAGWNRMDVGGFDPKVVNWIEFHVDALRNN